MRRALSACALAILVPFGGTSEARAFASGTGFSAAVYATGLAAATNAAGIAFIGATLYVVDPADGGLYRGLPGPAPIALTRVATIGGGPTGIAALGGALYVTRAAAGDIVRVDPASGAIVATIATIPCVNALAADPLTGDLFVTSCDLLWRITTPATAPVLTRYAEIFPGGAGTYGITISTDDTIYVALPMFGQIWRVQGPTQLGGEPPQRAVIGYTTAPRGLVQVGSFLFANGADGTITKVPLPGQGLSNIVALTAGDAGDLAVLGADGCLYASQGAAIVRVGDDRGGCDLVHAAPPQPAPTLVLVNTSTTPPLVGGGDQAFTATLLNVATPGSIAVTFAVTGANPRSRATTTGPNGVAAFAYSATATGTDTITATATVGGATLTSNTVTVVWPRAFDTAPPTITYSVAGTHAPSFACPRGDIGQPGVLEYCGWFTSAPTLVWTVTPRGPSGLDPTRAQCPPYTLNGTSPLSGTPVTCIASNGDGVSSSLQVRLQSSASPPSITASAATSAGPYVTGAVASAPVTVTFACDSAFGAQGVVSCTAPITVSVSGTTSVTGNVSDVTGTTRRVTFGPIVVHIPVESTSLAITSSPLLADGTPPRARLTGNGAPVAGATLRFAAGGLAATAITDANGVATATLGLAPGTYALEVTFEGSPTLFPSRAAQSLIVYAPTRFVVWAPNVTLGARVELYGAQWSKQIEDKDARKMLASFKGYADAADATSWTGREGDRVKAPDSLPQYIGVLVTSAATKSGDTIGGDVVGVVILRVEGGAKRPYAGRVGPEIFGTVVGAP